ncbi:eukaryotic translation initiation factor 5B [Salpingoeca rosetta]|uniref:Eukaryotic translation initiation factor 5B n=1 Tax=Salpingoeca rosetta (strain ATCC 50818 / BSB-021) TaxID=946362 RepID=F2U2B6_SALR5|nr:eukaryotic translation initiation factor 5B [Salpingoeca rosetta]EGD81768.1 eukaryotic translation initiation factor 5B [Salpingoeca rosetta]|eukprot:XP_004996972.1 eukaryotic translation initiation factor 5B [Salpingoeca rosetta]
MGKKKGRRNDDDDWMAEMEALNAEAKADLASDEDELDMSESELEALQAQQKKKQQQQQKKKNKKGKKQQQQVPQDMFMLSDEDEDEEGVAEQPPKQQQQKKKNKKNKKNNAKAEVEEEKEEVTLPSKQQKKKGKKKKGKKQQDAVDLDAFALELEDEMEAEAEAEAARKAEEEALRKKEQEEKEQQEEEEQEQEGKEKEKETEEAAGAEGEGKKEGAEGQQGESKKEKKKKKMSKLAQALKAEREAFEAKERKRKEEEEERQRKEEEERKKAEEEARREEERREKKRERERLRKQRRKAEAKKREKEKTEEEKQELARQKLAQMFGGDVTGPPSQHRPNNKQNQKKRQKQKELEAAKAAEEAAKAKAKEEEEAKKKMEEEEDQEVDNWEDLLDAADLGLGGDGDDGDDQAEDEGQDGATATAATAKPTAAAAAAGGDGDGDDDDDEEEGDEAAVETYTRSAESRVERQHKTQEELHEERVEAARLEIERRRQENEAKRTTDKLRSPICAVLGHVDTGKTKLLDKIRRSHVQDGEAGGITQQIGATYIPTDEIERQTAKVKKGSKFEIKVPGLLVIDTPGHESFSNLRSRGSSLCNMAVLVVDIMHGIEPQTAESLEMLRKRKAPFVIALNKVDRLNGWIRTPNTPIQLALKKQKQPAIQDFETRLDHIKLQFAERGINTELYWKNKNIREYVNIVPTSAHTGEGVPDLLFLLVSLTQKMLAKALAYSEELECTVLEVKEVQGYGTTIDVILTNGTLREGDTIVLGGLEGPIVTTARSLLMPAPLKELRVKNAYVLHKEVRAAQGVKIAGKNLEKAVAGLPLYVAHTPEEEEVYKEEAERLLEDTLNAIKTVEKGVCVQASTLGSLEALLEFLRTEKIPVSAVNIGPVHRRDVTRCTIQLQRDPKYACILAFDVPVDADAKRYAAREGIRIFEADIIYHLEESFRKHMEEVKQQLRERYRNIAVFPCRLQIVPDCVFNARDPIVVGVRVEEGLLRTGTPLCVPSKDSVDIGVVSSMQFEHKEVDLAKKGQEVSIKIEPVSGEKKMVGRHFDVEDELVSRISRDSIDAVKNYFREDLSKEDWRLMARLKSVFKIL